MGSRFPDLKELGPLNAVEWETLRSLNRAYVDLRQEWESACALTGSLMAKVDLTEGYADPDPLHRHHLAAVDEVCTQAIGYEDRVGAITWRYAGAAAVLGMAVLDRLISGRPPLAPDLVELLASHEPSLGQLKEMCEAPYERMLAAREDDHGTEAEARENLLGLLNGAEHSVTSTDVGRRMNVEEIEACRLSVVTQDGMDAFWGDLLEPVLRLAETIPYNIVHWARRERTHPR